MKIYIMIHSDMETAKDQLQTAGCTQATTLKRFFSRGYLTNGSGSPLLAVQFFLYFSKKTPTNIIGFKFIRGELQ